MEMMNQKVMRLMKEKVKNLRFHMGENISILEKDPNLEGLEYHDSIVAVRCGKQDHAHTSILFPSNREVREEILEKIYHEAGASFVNEEKEEKEVLLPKRIVFHNRQAIGDIIMFTCAIRDFKRQFPNIKVQVQSTVSHMWDFNPNIDRETWTDIIDPLSFKKEERKPSDSEMVEYNRRAVKEAIEKDGAVKLYIGPGKATNASNRSDNHFANAFRISIENILGIKIEQGPIRGDLYMTEEEYNRPPIIEPPYWLITAGEKGDWTAKTFEFGKWKEVVEKLPQIKFVQIGSRGHKHPKLSGRNVIDFIGKTEDRNTGFRDLLNLFNYCEGSAGLVSFQMHLAAVFNKPCVVISGAREPVWFTRYPGQQYLATDGCLPCTITNQDAPTACWKCDINGCPNGITLDESGQKVPLCADIISSEDVVQAILKYYNGGRLSIEFDKSSGRSKLINVVKTPPKVFVQEKEPERPFGMDWGGSSITDKDWEYIKQIIKNEEVKSICEFGVGLSTLLFDSFGVKVVPYETRQEDIDRFKKMNPSLDIRLWDGKKIFIPEKADLVFVDGPGGGKNREPSFIIAKNFDRVLIHDAGRPTELQWAEKHLKESYEKISQGGHRTAFWKRKTEVGACTPPVKAPNSNRVRIVFNGRGEGGAEGSVTWLLNEFDKRGWNTEYISPKQAPCGTFRNKGNSNTIFLNDLKKIKEETDLLVLYVNDWVWEFTKPEIEEVFSELKATRKVMVVNFRMGGIGTDKAKWTRDWDKYLFLNSSLENTLKERIPLAKTRSMAPPMDLSKFFDRKVDYSGNLKIVRHSSQGDSKYPKNFNEILQEVFDSIEDEASLRLMPSPTFLSNEFVERFKVVCHKRNDPSVDEFLSLGNCFWYCLPEGYEDQGPKVIMEAQSVGLPVVADNHSGAKDRVIPSSGFLCNSVKDYIFALEELQNPELRARMGESAKEHARREYSPDKWIEEILS